MKNITREAYSADDVEEGEDMKRMAILSLLAFLVLPFSACGNATEISKSMVKSIFPVQTEDMLETSDIEKEESNVCVTNENACNLENSERKILIAYFSLADIVPEGADASAHATPKIGNTESAALELQRQIGGDLFAIKTVQAYPVNHRECSAIAEKEMRSDARPKLSAHVNNMDDYDTVYIGYPIWWYQEPMAIRSFLEEYDFSGKTIIPFCTSFGASVEKSEENIKALCPDSSVLKGVTLYTGENTFSEPIAKWLVEIGMEK